MLPDCLRVLYLHGFASGPRSRKATFFLQNFQALGIPFEVPDLAAGNFERLTVTGQLSLIEKILATGSRARDATGTRACDRTVLMGSSLGGYLAALVAAHHPEVARLVLLAPAFHFHELWTRELGPERLELWRKSGSLSTFHYGEGRDMPIGYQLLEDAGRYEPAPAFRQPALIFHGTEDRVVPVQYSAEFAQVHPNVRLVRLQSGHELTDVLDEIWQQTKDFLLPNPAAESDRLGVLNRL